jgi:hypothetical protein
VLATAQVSAALKGVTVTDAAIIDCDRRGASVRALEVTFTHKRGHGRTVLFDLGPCDLSIHNWAERQRERIAKNGNGQSARERKVAVMVRRLEKEKKALYLRRPVHPLLPSEFHMHEGSDRYLRESEWRWHSEKAQRKVLARIAGQVLKHRITATTGYKLLREAGFEFTRFSDLRKHDRDRLPWQDDYWKHLHTITHGLLATVSRAKDYKRDPDEGDEFTRHRKSLVEYIADKRQAEALDSQIEALQELAA